jgi:hypothetical protein
MDEEKECQKALFGFVDFEVGGIDSCRFWRLPLCA